ncbi:hypothetical protein pqer_cds_992 [Pandoravirus quercus]|uniref:Uncharacterized protein n=2 Tax=Pandoravirus TaxID=2060084 RepID=A0A2U7UAF0_9VIRU|nr:hypothetical protein pqer_cds_992 [Pandoravirus quercus]AVK75414.1 hypothetical protein pqer_cds_992 [Pandoravirus quercus]QBZ81594.1 hypothetical protein pclt_cds_1008 [Pandoravirus celtis]
MRALIDAHLRTKETATAQATSMSSTNLFYSRRAPTEPTADPKPALTLQGLWTILATMPADALVARIKLAPAFVVPGQSYFDICPSSALATIDVDAFEGAASIAIQYDEYNPMAASEMAEGVAPLMRRHADRQLISRSGATVTGLSTVSKIAIGERAFPAKLCSDLAAASSTLVKAAEALTQAGKMDDASIINSMEPALPNGAHVRLYRVGDRIFEASDLSSAFPRLTYQERTDLFVQVERPAGPTTGMHGRLSMWAAPADITYDMLLAVFGPTQSALDRLRNIAAALGTRDATC